MQGRKDGMLPYGQGCHLHPDCFTCPGPSRCVVQYGANRKEQGKTARIWMPYFKQRVEALGGNGE